ncbi:Disintegrin and metalloproteinase domain-containing protein 29 [Labeo rohita]|uniref:Disintegrin and metalloproteinase domain-containing protein 29 n=1 Tax=Labeo rohita TaxID=84645 RepID=A0ABQ8L542_LABRO|nr:Disintegrin and metalloproteinase domain-containing protein 29 [Labeo rohita]
MCYYTLHTKTTAEEALWGLRQGGWRLEQYVEEFLKLANQLSWHDAALGACFQLGLDNETIHCDLPVCEYPLIELINLVLYLNGSNFEVEEIKEDSKSRRPAPSGTRHIMPVHASPGTPTYRTNGSDRLPNPKHPHILQSSISFLSPEPPAVARSNPPAAARHSRPPVTAPHSRPPVAAPPERPPVPTPSERRPEPAPPEPPPREERGAGRTELIKHLKQPRPERDEFYRADFGKFYGFRIGALHHPSATSYGVSYR